MSYWMLRKTGPVRWYVYAQNRGTGKKTSKIDKKSRVAMVQVAINGLG